MLTRYLLSIAALCLAAAPLRAQGGLAFSLGHPDGATILQPGDTIDFPDSLVGEISQAVITIRNNGSGAYTIQAAGASGEGYSASASTNSLPAGGTATVTVTLQASSLGPHNGTLTLRLGGPNSQTSIASFALRGNTPGGVVVSYGVGTNPTVALTEGGTIAFPKSPVNTPLSARIVVSNATATPVTVESVTNAGSAFTISSLTSLPAIVSGQSELTFFITFLPTDAQVYTGTLEVKITGRNRTYAVRGEGTASTLTYEWSAAGVTTEIAPGGTIPFGSVRANSDDVLAKMTIRNRSETAASVLSIGSDNVNFQLSGLPQLPFTLPSGGTASFFVRFRPVQGRSISGTLKIGEIPFVLTGTGTGPVMTPSLLFGGNSVPVPPGVGATLPATPVGASLPFTIEIKNTGTEAGTLDRFDIIGNGLTLKAAASLPAALEPDTSVLFSAVFQPFSLGIVNAQIHAGPAVYALTASGAPPPALPAVTFVNVGDTLEPLTQPGVGLQLAEAYPYDLTGRLTVSFAPGPLTDDPAIRFVAGTRYIDFAIPAGATEAVFTNGEKQAFFQTGSTAGTLRLTAAFAIGSYDLTGSAAPVKSMNIPRLAPVLRSVELQKTPSGSITLQLTGYTTTHTLTALSFQFAPGPGSNFPPATLTANVAEAFQAWFKGGGAASFGGQFSVTVPFHINGSLGKTPSIAAGATNDVGASPLIPATPR